MRMQKMVLWSPRDSDLDRNCVELRIKALPLLPVTSTFECESSPRVGISSNGYV